MNSEDVFQFLCYEPPMRLYKMWWGYPYYSHWGVHCNVNEYARVQWQMVLWRYPKISLTWSCDRNSQWWVRGHERLVVA